MKYVQKYNCEICELEVIVKGQTNGKDNQKLSLDFKEGTQVVRTWEVCEECAKKLIEYAVILKQSAKEFYFKG